MRTPKDWVELLSFVAMSRWARTVALATAAAVTGCQSTSRLAHMGRTPNGTERAEERQLAWKDVHAPNSKFGAGVFHRAAKLAAPTAAAAATSPQEASVDKPIVLTTASAPKVAEAEVVSVITQDGKELKVQKSQLQPVAVDKSVKSAQLQLLPTDGEPAAPPMVGMAPPEVISSPEGIVEGEVVELCCEPLGGLCCDPHGGWGFDGNGPIRTMGMQGASPDAPGILDNFSVRMGGAGYNIDNDSSAGFLTALDASGQLFNSNFFWHGGVAGQSLENDWPISGSMGLSRLAVIEGGRVVRPIILSAVYDSYFDNGFVGQDNQGDGYLGQVRALAGWALRPWIDVGVWGSFSSTDIDKTWQTPIPGAGTVTVHQRTRRTDRFAGYAAVDVPKLGGTWITSMGFQQGDAKAFAESDVFIPVVNWLNFWGGAGYSSNGNVDCAVGLELIPAGFAGRRHGVGGGGGADGCSDACASTCGGDVRYRGGYANGVYRGALRVETPARVRRTTEQITQ